MRAGGHGSGVGGGVVEGFINSLLSHADAFRWIFFIGLLWAFYRWMQSDDSEGIEWRDFVSTKGVDGKYHGDIDKVGKSSGVVFGSVMIVQISPHASKDFTGFALVLTAYFAFVGCVAGYSAYLRSKQGSITTVTEPVPDPIPVKTTVTQAAPVANKKGTK